MCWSAAPRRPWELRRQLQLPWPGSAGGARRGPRLLQPQAPPPRLPFPVRPPAQSAAGPRGAWWLVWPGEAERDPREPRRPPTRDQHDSPDTALPPPSHCRGDAPSHAARAEIRFSSSDREKSAESRTAAPGSSEPRPLPLRLAAGGGDGGGGKCASLPGGEFHLQAEAAAASCIKAAAAGAGASGAPWPWREDPDPGTPEARLGLFGPLYRPE